MNEAAAARFPEASSGCPRRPPLGRDSAAGRGTSHSEGQIRRSPRRGNAGTRRCIPRRENAKRSSRAASRRKGRARAQLRCCCATDTAALGSRARCENIGASLQKASGSRASTERRTAWGGPALWRARGALVARKEPPRQRKACVPGKMPERGWVDPVSGLVLRSRRGDDCGAGPSGALAALPPPRGGNGSSLALPVSSRASVCVGGRVSRWGSSPATRAVTPTLRRVPQGPARGGTNWPRTSASATVVPRSPVGTPARRGRSARAATTPCAARATAAVENNQARPRPQREGSGLWKEDLTTPTLGPVAAPAALERPPSSGRARKRGCASTRHEEVTAPRVQTQTTPAARTLAPSALGTAVGGDRSLSFPFFFLSDFALACKEPVIA